MKKILAAILALCLCLCAAGGAPAYAAAEKTDAEFAMGKTENNRYENSFFGYGLELGEEFTFASPEELAALIGTTAEMFTSEAYREQMMSLDMYYDMQASAGQGIESVIVAVQNIGKLYGVMITPEMYATAALEGTVLQLEDAGFTDVKAAEKSLVIDGTEIPGIHVSCKVQDLDYYSQILVFKQGGYLSIVTFNSFLEDHTAEMANALFFLDQEKP